MSSLNKLPLKIFPLAQADLKNIIEYISVELSNRKAAADLIDDFENAFDNIRLFPECCPRVDNEYVNDKSLRKLIVKNYIAFYRLKNNEIQVVRVLYGLQNYAEIL